MHWWWNNGWSWWYWAVMTIGMIAFWGLVVWAFIAFVRPPGRSSIEETPREPEQILVRRFALGQVDSDEYHRRLESLRSATTATAVRDESTSPSNGARVA